MTMNNRFSASTNRQSWRELYRAALFETDHQKLPLCIDEAEKALILRGRELFSISGDTGEEAQAIDDALYALRALRNCLKLKTREREAA